MNISRKIGYINLKKMYAAIVVSLGLIACICCKKEVPKVYNPKKVVYLVRGTQFRLNFIDSNSVFQKDKVFRDSFRYEFIKGPGASIGISIYRFSAADTIFSWELFLDGQLFANAFSEGGVYSTVPYD